MHLTPNKEDKIMSASIETRSTFEELDYREGDGIAVSLLWSRVENSLSVLVVDARTDEQFELSVEPAEAMTVFRHPFAYATTRRHQRALDRV
jgi:hypothetical protein